MPVSGFPPADINITRTDSTPNQTNQANDHNLFAADINILKNEQVAYEASNATTIAGLAARIAALENAGAGGGTQGGNPSWTASGAPNGTQGTSYSYTYVANGPPTPTYSVTAGSLPAGLSLNGTTGVLSGLPTTVASYTFTITATNSVGSISVSNTIGIVASGTTPDPPNVTVGLAHPGGGSWTLVFDDEFTGSSLDTTKWRPNWLGSNDTDITKPVNGNEQAAYAPSQVTVANGVCTLTAKQQATTDNQGTAWNYRSGMIQTAPHYTFTHGYIEARIWLPPGSGTPINWPAFWTDTTGTWPNDGENDIMEILNGNWAVHLHWGSGGVEGGPALAINPGGATGGWHTFSCSWISATSLDYYYDNTHIGQFTTHIPASTHFIILNNALSSSISPPITVPASMQVEYVRVWQ